MTGSAKLRDPPAAPPVTACTVQAVRDVLAHGAVVTVVGSGRAGQEGPPAWVTERFAGARVARLATLHHGAPRIVPVTFAWHLGVAVWAVDQVKPKRGRRLRRLDDIAADPRVSMLADRYHDDWDRLWWVELQGTAAELTDAREAAAALDALAARYGQYAARRPAGPVVAVTPTGWAWWSATGPASG
jgi:PPOX class probable F420-dependent enzyme